MKIKSRIVLTALAFWATLFSQAAFFSSVANAQLDFAMAEGDITGGVAERVWTGSFGSGLNGKSGNSENIDINVNLDMQRKVDLNLTKLQANYFFAENTLGKTTDRFFSLLRQEREFANNPRWSWFGQGTFETDEFKAFDSRLALHTGFGFKVYELDDRFLKLRFGGGASRQNGGVNEAWVPELQFGGDWERKLSERTRLYASADFFPNTSDFGDYRLNTSGGVEFIVDDELNLNLRLFFLNIYDSTPEPGNQSNDLDYGAAFVFGF